MDVADKTLSTCAKNIINTANLSRGDAVVIKGGAHTLDLLEKIALECYRKGATPSIVVSSDKFTKQVYDEIPVATLQTIPKELVGMVKASDMIIMVEELDDPSMAAHFPRKKMHARQKGILPIHDMLSHPTDGKKWLYVGWPTKAAARAHGIGYRSLEQVIIGGMMVSPGVLMAIGRRIDRKFKDASWVNVWDDNGTDLRVKIEGRRHNIDDGVISKEDFDAGDRGANLPAGELFFAPHETIGEGTLFCPITRDRSSEKVISDVQLEFKAGRLLLDKVTASENVDALVTSFRECMRLDEGKYDPVRTTNLAELGMGFNPRIRKAIGYILTDEKVTGTVHVAFGMNNGYGGKSNSTMHWDFVTAPSANIDVERVDGKIIQVMRNGKFH